MSVVIRQADTIVTAPAAEFTNEAELEQVLAEQVALLQSPTDRPLALVSRQVSLLDAGTLDLLCVDENGLPVAVEVKLARNGESRRSVVAQIVDYLSALTTMTVDELDLGVEGKLEAALKSFDGPNGLEGFEQRWQALGANLRAGFARIVVALDEEPTDLRRIVRFLSEHSNLDIRLVTISKFVDPRVGTVYVPNIIVSNEGTPAPRPSARPLGLSPDAFMAKWESGAGPDAASAWRSFSEALVGADIEGLQFGHYPGGAPYIYLNTGLGPVRLLRLGDKKGEKAQLRDLLNMGPLWEQNPGAATARDSFRAALLRLLPGSELGGDANRVYAPVDGLLLQCDAVVTAVRQLAQEIKLALR